MQASAITHNNLTAADTEALLRLIESIRADKTDSAASAQPLAKAATVNAGAAMAPEADTGSQSMPADSDSGILPALGRYVNIWA